MAPEAALADYNVVWDSPSENSSGSVPLGNGDFAANVWVEPNGDLLILPAKSDAWDENSINLKLGRIRIQFSPDPLATGAVFRQSLRLETAEIGIQIASLRVRIWIDANQPVIRLEAQSDEPVQMQAKLEMWRTSPRQIQTQTSDMFKNLVGKNSDPFPTIVQPDEVLDGGGKRIIWCHHNRKLEHDPYEINMKLQGLGGLLEAMPHPLLGRTFGAAMQGQGLVCSDDRTLQSIEPRRSHGLEIVALTLHPSTPSAWQAEMESRIAGIGKLDLETARKNHERWWHDFWNRSWIFVTAASAEENKHVFAITQSYILQRFMNAAAGRGAMPIKHNGSLFSVGSADDPDFRRWGGPGFWFQNQRLIYWPMLASGDFDLMRPWIDMYLQMLPLQEHRTQTYFHHGGAHYPETVTFWGAEVSGHYGWTPFEQRKTPEAECRWLTYYWTGGLELTVILCEYYFFTNDAAFVRSHLNPLAHAVTEFFDLHYPRNENGKMHFEPAQALETWHVAVNPTPEIAGLNYVLRRLLEIPEELTSAEDRQRWTRMLGELPPLPIGKIDGKTVVLPAERFEDKKNTENPELYCIFPYRIFGVGKPDLQLGRDTFESRLIRLHECWSQDEIQMALLGLADQAREWLIGRSSPAAHSDSRFPAFWNAFHDWIPDVDHGGVLQLALQLMLVQSDEQETVLLPAWPKEWNVDFKLHTPNQGIVEASVRDGQIVQLKMTP